MTTPAPWIVVTGLDGSGKTTLSCRLAQERGGFHFRLPHHEFVKAALTRSGYGDPYGDAHTDRLVFAADARLTNYLIREWRQTHPLLVSQRGWMDSFVFGVVQGISYQETDSLLRTPELERPSAIVHLVAEPQAAYERICHDPDADKYETLQFMRRQYQATVDFFHAVQADLPVLAPFAGIPALLIDTTQRTPEEVYATAERFLFGQEG
ncbi:MAG TPA: hypothetical protein VKT32_13760 [Chthonomonadaceae bacterium]|nr:hypothetical protein [Chthonomonadaceae bacterium]